MRMRGKGYACFSGKCDTCKIELEHVSQGPNVGLIEIYPVEVAVTKKPRGDAPAAELPPDETDKWFCSEPPKPKRKPRERKHPAE